MSNYFERYKASSEIFEKIKPLKLGENLIIRGISTNLFETEARIYYLNSKDQLIKEFLPGAYVMNEEEAIEKLHEFMAGYLLKTYILFCIAPKELQIPFGYILCNSPLAVYQNTSRRINDWTIEFWLAENLRGKGIMTGAVSAILAYYKRWKCQWFMPT